MAGSDEDAAAADELARWRAERRHIVRTHHPDAGGTASALESALAAHDRSHPSAASAASAATAPGPARARPDAGNVVAKSTRRGRSTVRRRVRRIVDAARNKVPRRLPGARRSARY